jgi:hypothetical protein
MLNRVRSCVPAVLAFAVIGGAAAMSYTRTAHAVDSCLAEPDLQSTEPGHWYYRIDTATHRKCWFLSSDPPGARQAAPAKPAAAPVPLPRPATNAPATPPAAVQADAPAPASVNTLKPTDLIQPLATTNRTATDNKQSDQTSSDEMPLVWPILTPAELAAAAQTNDTPTIPTKIDSKIELKNVPKIEPMSPVLIVALALAAIAIVAGCTILTYVLLQRRGRRNLAKLRRRQSLRGYPLEREMLTASRGFVPSAPQPEEPNQTSEPVDAPHAIEEALEQLARSWERSAA